MLSLLYPKAEKPVAVETTDYPPSPNGVPITLNFKRTRLSLLNAQSNGDYASEQLIEDLRVPQQWLEPSKALEESEWLRTALNKWLDDEYCPEETNIEISRVAASSFYRSLLENKTDIGEILLKMAGDLESISYQESFHGAFSSANAAVSLIIQRLEQN
ncbi:hypothetical protein RND71_006988 [Anisodus tanguticus]|uniref:Uncharacterized protein n=1 Tax=Anisodus tanguticus TaxID=243964 RepID=A0AAE1SX63_9SOLA|nr:hypothetical protein RND71_006988 [Anisodus tanguticus]